MAYDDPQSAMARVRMYTDDQVRLAMLRKA